jgi:hypothetical protein
MWLDDEKEPPLFALVNYMSRPDAHFFLFLVFMLVVTTPKLVKRLPAFFFFFFLSFELKTRPNMSIFVS